MGRLVDIDDVIKAVDRHTKDEFEIVLDNDITCILEEVPTAYDVDAVVAEFEEKSSNHTKSYKSKGKNTYKTIKAISKNKAIDIVKRGGVE